MGLRRISPCTDSVSLNISKSLNNSTHYVSIPAMFQEPRVCVSIRFQVYPISRLLINNQILVRKLIYKMAASPGDIWHSTMGASALLRRRENIFDRSGGRVEGQGFWLRCSRSSHEG